MNMRIFLIMLFAGAVVFGAWSAAASSKDDIVFPVAELGNCADEQACHVYCDDIENASQCLSFAEQHNVMSASEIAEARKFAGKGITAGPGGCRGKVQCEAYCEDVSNIEECLAFAEQHSILDGHELEEARRVAAALRQGAQLPGGCTSKASCEAYCEEPTHMEECVEFGIAAGFIPPEEAEEVRRILPLMKEGRMPGGCREREECEAYCAQEQHVEECTAFFVEAGFMTPEEAEMFRKTGGRGPGGCQGREECEAYCNNPENQQACFAFAKEHGILPEDEIQNIEEGLAQFREGLQHATPAIAECLRNTIGEDVLAKIEAGTFLPNPEIGEHMRQCFEEHAADIIEHEIREGARDVPPEAAECIQRIVGGLSGPPSPELEERIRQECFPQEPEHPEDFEDFREIEHVLPPGNEIPEEFREQFHEEFEQRQQEEFQRQFEQQAPEGFQPPEGFEIPEEFQQFQEEHSTEPAPTTRVGSFLGAVVDAAAPALKRWLPFLPL